MNQFFTERGVQGNKVSMVPNDSVVKVVKIENPVRLRKESRSFAKTQKPESNILNDGDKKKSSFEDSRITMLLFEKYKSVELTRFFTIAASMILIVLEYEYSYSTQLTRILEEEMKLFLYLIMFFTIVSIVLTFVSYQVLMAYQKEAQMITPQASLSETPLIWGIVWEILLLILNPTPYTCYQKIEFQQRYTDTIRFYYLNEIFTFLGMFKGFLLLNIIFKFQKYSSSRIGRICRLYSADFNTHLMLKLCIRDKPFETLSILFAGGMFVFGYSLEVAERALFRLEDSLDPSYISNRFWINLITIFTVGYGDFFPYTDLGRVAMACSVVYGVVVTSLFTATLYSLLTPQNGECLVWALLEKANVRNTIQNVSGNILLKLNDLSKKHSGQFKTIEETFIVKDQIAILNNLLQEVVTLKRQYRDIDGEEFMAMVKRKFKDINGQFEDVQEFLEKLQKQQKLISSTIEKPFDFSVKQSIKVKESSKDDDFFDNLNETNNCSYLMRFEDD
ncbi:unnamed protein product [Paramecium sonneborni]|uniref:Potassium channel domain-containing protein n=1 Tax=Paramecium sonneborni TaxID=65129 RepID=A0A8S1MRU9_9CILI|nr:unnamed protein product [Paramecium sonneborni]